jgi:hypothetical protein
VTVVEPFKHYPNPDDQTAALLAYGSGNEAFINGNRARVLARPEMDWRKTNPVIGHTPISGTELQSTKLATSPQLNQPMAGTGHTAAIYAAAQQAANRSALAKLGYDPRAFALDVKAPSNVTIAGAYSTKSDSGYVNANHPSTIIHESIHRGVQKLRDAKNADGSAVVPEHLRPYIESSGRSAFGEEGLVRYIMATQMGDPETGDFDVREKNSAIYNFDKFEGGRHREALKELELLAARYLSKRTPGGPR